MQIKVGEQIMDKEGLEQIEGLIEQRTYLKHYCSTVTTRIKNDKELLTAIKKDIKIFDKKIAKLRTEVKNS